LINRSRKRLQKNEPKRFSHQKRTDLHFYATILFAAAAHDSAAKSFHPLMIAAAAAAAGAISAAISAMRWPRNPQYAITDRIDLHIKKLLQSQREQEKRIQVAEDDDHSKITKKAFSRQKSSERREFRSSSMGNASPGGAGRDSNCFHKR
jgi:hypothetical protein